MMIETIAAPATAPGLAGVGIIRVSGPLVSSITQQLIGVLPKPRFATYAEFLDKEKSVIHGQKDATLTRDVFQAFYFIAKVFFPKIKKHENVTNHFGIKKSGLVLIAGLIRVKEKMFFGHNLLILRLKLGPWGRSRLYLSVFVL